MNHSKFNDHKKALTELLEMGMPNTLIAKYLDINVATAQKHINLLKQEGWEGNVNTPVKAIPAMLAVLAKIDKGRYALTPDGGTSIRNYDLVVALRDVLQVEKIVSSLELVSQSVLRMCYPAFAKDVPEGYGNFLELMFHPYDLRNRATGNFLWRDYLDNIDSNKSPDTENWPSKIIEEIVIDFTDSMRDSVMPLFTMEHCRRVDANFMPTLTERECEVLKMFFGLGVSKMTLEEIAEKLDLTRERVRQLKEKGVRRGRHLSRQKLILEEQPPAPPVVNPVPGVRIKIEDCDFSVRAHNCIKAAGIAFLDEFSNFRKGELLNFRNFGMKSIVEIEEILPKYGLSFREEVTA